MANAVAEPRPKLICIVWHPIYSVLLPLPVVCFIGVLLTGVTYLKSGGNLIWLAFSSWLLLAGLLFGAIAALALLIDFIRAVLDNLNSPFGVVLVGGDLYVAETDKIMRYPFTPGQTQITAPGVKVQAEVAVARPCSGERQHRGAAGREAGQAWPQGQSVRATR
jgi:hypothetical protein